VCVPPFKRLKYLHDVRFEILLAVLLQIQIFWDVTLCRVVNNCLPFYMASYSRRFESLIAVVKFWLHCNLPDDLISMVQFVTFAKSCFEILCTKCSEQES